MHAIDINFITYRKIRKDEIPTLVEYRIKFLIELQGMQSIEKIDKLKIELYQYFENAFDNHSFVAFVAESDKKIVAFAGMVIQYLPGNFTLLNGMEGHILNMYTLPEYRKNGLCGELLDHLIKEGKVLGLNRLFLHASTNGYELYRRKGFCESVLPEMVLKL